MLIQTVHRHERREPLLCIMIMGLGFAAVDVWTWNTVEAGLAVKACLVVEYGLVVKAAFVVEAALVV